MLSRGGIHNWLALVALAVACAIALVSCGEDQRHEHSLTRAESRAVSPARTLAPEYAIFRRGAQARDRLPADLITKQAAQRFGLETSSARLTYIAPFGRFFVIPSRYGLVCLVSTDEVTSNCWPTRTVASDIAVSTTFCGPILPKDTLEIVGLVPDHVGAITLASKGGAGLVARVKENTFVERLHLGRSLPTDLIWKRDGRTHRQLAAVSSSFAHRACAPQSPPRGVRGARPR